MPGEAAGSGGKELNAGAGAGWENGECGGMDLTVTCGERED